MNSTGEGGGGILKIYIYILTESREWLRRRVFFYCVLLLCRGKNKKVLKESRMSVPLSIQDASDPLGITCRRKAQAAGVYAEGRSTVPGVSEVILIDSKSYVAAGGNTLNPLLADVLQTALHARNFLRAADTAPYSAEHICEVATATAADSTTAYSLREAMEKLDLNRVGMEIVGEVSSDDERPPGISQLYMHVLKHAVGRRVMLLLLFQQVSRCIAIIGELGQPYVLVDAQRAIMCQLSSPITAIPEYIRGQCLTPGAPEPAYSALVIAAPTVPGFVEEEEKQEPLPPPPAEEEKEEKEPTPPPKRRRKKKVEPPPPPEEPEEKVEPEHSDAMQIDDDDGDDDTAAAVAVAPEEQAEDDTMMSAMSLKAPARRSRRKRK